ncbi:MAG: hypothetical protein IKL48_05370 [Elusimicrobiaceae bacterium]|nr:hypothetical protein [Elusimicrobiaceae bacterium]
MRKLFWLFVLTILALPLSAQEAVGELTQEELSVIESIKAKNQTTSQPSIQEPQTEQEALSNPTDIKLSQQTKQDAFAETESQTEDLPEELAVQELTQEEKSPQKCLLVAYIDIDIAFNEHPRTQAVKKQIDLKIKSKQREVENAKDIINALELENKLLSRQLAELKPFYERIITDQILLPKVPESADTLLLNNTLNRLIFSGTEVLSTSPLNSPARLDDLTERIGANKKIIAERSFFIDNYKYQTREEILRLEEQEVKAILQDIYNEIKSFAKKRNIGAIVRKDEILYGQEPVNVTTDFVNRLKKSKKYRKK